MGPLSPVSPEQLGREPASRPAGPRSACASPSPAAAAGPGGAAARAAGKPPGLLGHRQRRREAAAPPSGAEGSGAAAGAAFRHEPRCFPRGAEIEHRLHGAGAGTGHLTAAARLLSGSGGVLTSG